MELVLDDADINILIEEHMVEFTTDDLKNLKAMQLTSIQEDILSSDSDVAGDAEHMLSAKLRETIC